LLTSAGGRLRQPGLTVQSSPSRSLKEHGSVLRQPPEKTHLAICHIYDMGFRMKTTLNIDDTVMAELKREAARQGRTMSELVESALRLLFASRRKRGRIPALPKFRSGGALVDVADRDALYHAMEGR
jgi:Arc/MetJ family transcription regulator